MGKETDRGGIQIHSHPVYTRLHHLRQRLLQVLGVDIMLILSHSDRFGIDLHQLCQRVLMPSGLRTSQM